MGKGDKGESGGEVFFDLEDFETSDESPSGEVADHGAVGAGEVFFDAADFEDPGAGIESDQIKTVDRAAFLGGGAGAGGEGEVVELELTFQDDPGSVSSGEVEDLSAYGAGEIFFDPEALEKAASEQEAKEAAKTAEARGSGPEEDAGSSLLEMQGGFEVTDVYAGFDAASGFATAAQVTYEGISLAVRELFAPVEEFLHESAGAEDGISILEASAEEIFEAFSLSLPQLAREHGVIPLVVTPSELLCDGRPVLRDISEGRSGLFRLYAAGVQAMNVVAGVNAAQVNDFVRLLTEASAQDEAAIDQADIVGQWWSLGLTHVRLSVLETFTEVEPLPDTGLAVIEVPDQAVEQLGRLRSRLLAAVPGVGKGSGRERAVRTLVVTRDDLRAMEQGLFEGGAALLAAPLRDRGLVPFPDRLDDTAAIGRELAGASSDVRERFTDALLSSILKLQAGERSAGIVEGILEGPRAQVREGEIEVAITFLGGLARWRESSKPGTPRHDVGSIVLEAASAPSTLGLMLRSLSEDDPRWERVKAFIALLPCQATCTMGAAVHDRVGGPALSELFELRLQEDLVEILKGIDRLEAELLIGLLAGARAVRSPGLSRLIPVLLRSPHPELRSEVARAVGLLGAEQAQAIVWTLLLDDVAEVRASMIEVIAAHPQRAQLCALVLRVMHHASFREWRFSEQRQAVFTVVRSIGHLAAEPLHVLAVKKNTWHRASLSQTRATALLGLAALGAPQAQAAGAAVAAEKERRLTLAAAQAAQGSKEPAEGDALASRILTLEQAFVRFDDTIEEGARVEAEAVREISPQAREAMKIDRLLAAPGDPVQILGCQLAIELSTAMHWTRLKKSSSRQFTIATGRAAALVRALCELGDGTCALQNFDAHFFLSGERLRMPIATFKAIETLRKVLGRLRVQELLFAEAPSRPDIEEVIFALETAMRIEREPWVALERDFTRIRLRELSLIRESWGRPPGLSVDIRANAARLFGMVQLWLQDVAALPDEAPLFQRRADRLVRELVDADLEGEVLLPGLLEVKENEGDASFLLAQITLAATIFARRLGLGREAIAQVARCALHHGLGLGTLPPSLQIDLGNEGGTEVLELASVPAYSVARLAHGGLIAGEVAMLLVVSAFESLAPLKVAGRRRLPYLKARPPLLHARLLSVVGRYLYLTTRFPGREAFGADRALRAMLEDPELDRALCEHWANLAQVLPTGSAVRLRDGREALVIASPVEIDAEHPLVLRPFRESNGQPSGRPVLGPSLIVRADREAVSIIVGAGQGLLQNLEWSELQALVLPP